MTVKSIWRALRAHPSGVLLAVQLLGIVLYPFLDRSTQGGSFGRLVLALFGLAVLVIAVGVSVRTPIMTWLAVLVALPTAVLTVVDWIVGATQPVHLISDIFHALFYLYTCIGLIIYMFSDEDVKLDELLAVGATFTVAVWLFAYLYSIVQTLVPGSFTAAVNADEARTWVELLYLSTTTMTSTGLSDIVPVSAYARSVVMLQQIAGMLYLAMVVARIVGLTINRRRPDPARGKVSGDGRVRRLGRRPSTGKNTTPGP